MPAWLKTWPSLTCSPLRALTVSIRLRSSRSRPSRTSLSVWRKSTVKVASPGTWLKPPGLAAMLPTVATAGGPIRRAIVSAPLMISAAPASGSWRLAIGTVPAWPETPCSVTRITRTPTTLSTTPITSRDSTRTGPCSICGST